jgi:phosphoribosylformylglycinamidine synthase
MATPRALILRAPGTNCDEETAAAWTAAGARADTLHVSALLESPGQVETYQILTIPGGFSYGDDLGAGRIFASRIGSVLTEALTRFHDRGGLTLGICNGFQVLVRAGLLPGGPLSGSVTLCRNAHGKFEDRWVRLSAVGSKSLFLNGLGQIELPIAHGEGRFLAAEADDVRTLKDNQQIALRYVDESGNPAERFPENPNGSDESVAGLCDPSGRILGLMPHPERFIEPWHHPRWTRREPGFEPDGLRIFRNAVSVFRD